MQKRKIDKKRSAVILDRDGVLIQRHLLTWQKKQLKLSPRIAPLIRKFNNRNIPVIVITNQPVVARGWISEKGVEELHQILQARLNKNGAFIDKFYFCPHHPEATIKKYRMLCNCRKPKIGLYKKAAKELGVDLSKSISIGDMTQDILAGKRARLKTILVKTGHGGKDNKYKVSPDFIVKNTAEALKLTYKIIN